MANFEKALTGFNHNVKHKGKVYHVQTEDSGVKNAHIITHLFVGGNILASKKTSYNEILAVENLAEVARGLMEEQHKEMLRNLINGVYDTAEKSVETKHYQPGQLATPEEAATARQLADRSNQVSRSRPPPAEVAAAKQAAESPKVNDVGAETLFGEDLISEKSLDEVILGYLADTDR